MTGRNNVEGRNTLLKEFKVKHNKTKENFHMFDYKARLNRCDLNDNENMVLANLLYAYNCGLEIGFTVKPSNLIGNVKNRRTYLEAIDRYKIHLVQTVKPYKGQIGLWMVKDSIKQTEVQVVKVNCMAGLIRGGGKYIPKLVDSLHTTLNTTTVHSIASIANPQDLWSLYLGNKLSNNNNLNDFNSEVNMGLNLDKSMFIYDRIYSDVECTKGGRVYNGLTNMPRAVRSKLVFDGELTGEADFSACQPLMCYHLNGIDVDTTTDLYTRGLVGDVSKELRDVFKKGLNILLNCTVEQSAEQALRQYIRDEYDTTSVDGWKATDVIAMLWEQHLQIANHFHNSAWEYLQKIESDIIMKVAIDLNEMGITNTTIHDAVIVPVSKLEVAKKLMEKHYMMTLRFKPVVKIK